jgi:gamma-glutamyltranspeptidase/glutathione hydrolase
MRLRSAAAWKAVGVWAVLVVAACAPSPPTVAPTPRSLIPAGWPLFAKTKTVYAQRAMVSSVDPVASNVGVRILRRGGNAIDAAVAVGFALAVVHPAAGNIGGGGFMVIRLADGTVQTLDYRETAPGSSTENMYLDADGEPTGQSLA